MQNIIKISELKIFSTALLLLRSQDLFAQENEIKLNQPTEKIASYSNINDFVKNTGGSSFQADFVPQMQMDPVTEITTLRELFNKLRESDIDKVAAEKDITEAEAAITTGIEERDKAISAANTEIKETKQRKAKENKTTTKEIAETKVQSINQINVDNLWEKKAAKFRVKRKKENNAEKAVYFAKLAQIYEIAAEEISHAKNIWGILKDKKDVNFLLTNRKAVYIKLLDNTTKFTEKEPLARSEILLNEANQAWKKIEQTNMWGEIAKGADKVTNVLQYISPLGIFSPAAISSLISLGANSMDNREIAVKIAEDIEDSLRKYYAKVARIEAGKIAFRNPNWEQEMVTNIEHLQEELETLEEEQGNNKSKNLEQDLRNIERAKICFESAKAAWEIFRTIDPSKEVAKKEIEQDKNGSNISSSHQVLVSSSSRNQSMLESQNIENPNSENFSNKEITSLDLELKDNQLMNSDVSKYLKNEIMNNIYEECLAEVAKLTLRKPQFVGEEAALIKAEEEEWALAKEIATLAKDYTLIELDNARRETEKAEKAAEKAQEKIKSAALGSPFKGSECEQAISVATLSYEEARAAYLTSDCQAKKLHEKSAESKVKTAFANLNAILNRKTLQSVIAIKQIEAAKETEITAVQATDAAKIDLEAKAALLREAEETLNIAKKAMLESSGSTPVSPMTGSQKAAMKEVEVDQKIAEEALVKAKKVELAAKVAQGKAYEKNFDRDLNAYHEAEEAWKEVVAGYKTALTKARGAGLNDEELTAALANAEVQEATWRAHARCVKAKKVEQSIGTEASLDQLREAETAWTTTIEGYKMALAKATEVNVISEELTNSLNDAMSAQERIAVAKVLKEREEVAAREREIKRLRDSVKSAERNLSELSAFWASWDEHLGVVENAKKHWLEIASFTRGKRDHASWEYWNVGLLSNAWSAWQDWDKATHEAWNILEGHINSWDAEDVWHQIIVVKSNIWLQNAWEAEERRGTVAELVSGTATSAHGDLEIFNCFWDAWDNWDAKNAWDAKDAWNEVKVSCDQAKDDELKRAQEELVAAQKALGTIG